jgi:hypothetical protein
MENSFRPGIFSPCTFHPFPARYAVVVAVARRRCVVCCVCYYSYYYYCCHLVAAVVVGVAVVDHRRLRSHAFCGPWSLLLGFVFGGGYRDADSDDQGTGPSLDICPTTLDLKWTAHVSVRSPKLATDRHPTQMAANNAAAAGRQNNNNNNAAAGGGGGGGMNQNDHVEFSVRAEEDLYLQGSEATIRRVTADTNYSCLMLKTQRFSSLFRHYAKYHGLRKDDLEYYFVNLLENEDTPESVQLQRGDTIMVRFFVVVVAGICFVVI